MASNDPPAIGQMAPRQLKTVKHAFDIHREARSNSASLKSLNALFPAKPGSHGHRAFMQSVARQKIKAEAVMAVIGMADVPIARRPANDQGPHELIIKDIARHLNSRP